MQKDTELDFRTNDPLQSFVFNGLMMLLWKSMSKKLVEFDPAMTLFSACLVNSLYFCFEKKSCLAEYNFV